MSSKTVLVNCEVFTGKNAETIKNGAIAIENDSIVFVGKESEVNISEEDKVIDLKGSFVMPGLVDAHLHLQGFRTGDFVKEPLLTPFGVFVARAVRDAEELLSAGYTTVVDAGGLVALHLREAIKEGSVNGPRIVASGPPLSQTFGHADTHYLPVDWVDLRTTKRLTPFASLICDGEDECRKAARYALREGADFIKIMATGGVLSQKDRPEYTQFTRKEIKAIVEEAEKAGRIVHAHAQGTEGIVNAIDSGVRVIAHAIYMGEDEFELAKRRRAVIVPTLAIVDKILKVGEKQGVPEWGLKKAEEVYNIHIEMVRKAYKSGVLIASGTDYAGGWLPMGENSIELKIYIDKVGMKSADALITATKNGAYAAGLENITGTLEKGKKADLIAINGNPLTNIDTLLDKQNIVFVMKEGKVYKKLFTE